MTTIALLRCVACCLIFIGLLFYINSMSQSYFAREVIIVSGSDQSHELPSLSICLRKQGRRPAMAVRPFNDNSFHRRLTFIHYLFFASGHNIKLEPKRLIEGKNMTQTRFLKDGSFCTMVTTSIVKTKTDFLWEFTPLLKNKRFVWPS